MMFHLNRHAARALASSALVTCVSLLSACSGLGLPEAKPETLFGLFTPYRVDVVQGNVVTQEVVAQIQPGLGRLQVREILGTPLLTDVFHVDRWDYVFTIDRQGVPPQKRRVSVFFKNDAVERFDTEALPSEGEFVAAIDKPLNRPEPPLAMAPEQVAKLPVPAKSESTRKQPQGAARDYPSFERGQR